MPDNQAPHELPFFDKWFLDIETSDITAYDQSIRGIPLTDKEAVIQHLNDIHLKDFSSRERIKLTRSLLSMTERTDIDLLLGITALDGKCGFSVNYQASFEYLIRAWNNGKKEAAHPLLRLEWQSETYLLPAEIQINCFKWLAGNGDAGFSHYMLAQKEYIDQNLKNFFSNACCRRDGLATYCLIQFAVENMLLYSTPSVFYLPLINAIEEQASSEPRLYYYLGRLYLHEANPHRNIRNAVKAYSLGADAGSQRCQYALFYIHYYGAGVETDNSKAIGYLRQYSASNNYRSMVTLAHLYLTNISMLDENAALNLLQTAAIRLSPVKALLYLACYFHDKGDYRKALSYTSRHIECGSHNNCYSDLWILHQVLQAETDPTYPIPTETDSHVVTEIQQAYIAWRKLQSGKFENEKMKLVGLLTALSKNNRTCSYYLALCYEQGIGVAYNEKMAAVHMKEAEIASYIPAMFKMAEYYENGFYVNKAKNMAVQLYEDILSMSCYRSAYILNKLKQLNDDKSQNS